MKFKTAGELQNFSFDDAVIRELTVDEGQITFLFEGAIVKAGNSQNTRMQDMYCGEICLQLQNAHILKIIKEGYKYYDANDQLQEEVPNEEVPAPAQASVLERCGSGTLFTIVREQDDDAVYGFGIDVPQKEDEDEIDTYWLCLKFQQDQEQWDRFQTPLNP